MGPIPGISWADVSSIMGGFAMATIMIALQWWVAEAIAPEGRGRRAVQVLLIALVIPYLLVTLYAGTEESARFAVTILWLGGTILVRLVVMAAGEWASVLPSARSSSEQPRPNTLRQSSVPNALRGPEANTAIRAPIQARSSSLRLGGALVVVLLASLVVAPKAVLLAATQTPCESVEVLLAMQRREPLNLEPIDWMPPQPPSGYTLTLDRPVNLDLLIRSRRNPDESRVELIRDAYVDGYERSWSGRTDHIEIEAQRFAAIDGALNFQAFANRYACQFANEAFLGPRGSIGLQIRFASGKPIGEQVSWISGTTRIIVFVDHEAPPADHSRVESLVELVPRR